MDEAELRVLVEGLRAGTVEPDEAVARLRRLPFADLGFARVDHHRALRQGLPEAVYGPGKTADQCVAVVGELLHEPGGPVLLTRADDEQVAAVVAVPTSTGYGAGFEGVTALLSMLASCAAGITVVGIDNGFGAACAIARMLGTTSRAHG